MQHLLDPKFDVLVLSGGKAARLEKDRKVIQAKHLPSLHKYEGQEGPKGLTNLCIHGKNIPLLDLHLEQYWHHPCIQHITLGLGFAQQMIIDYYSQQSLAKPLRYTSERHPAGTLAPLLKLYQEKKLTQRPLLLANGDNLLKLNLKEIWQVAMHHCTQQNLNLDNLVIDIVTLVPWQESSSYGVVHFDEKSGMIDSFFEKQAIELNPYIEQNGEKFCYINSGFSIICNPLAFVERNVDKELFNIVQGLEAGELEYKEYEVQAKYESLYARIAKERQLLGVHQKGFWADSGSEERIKVIEKEYCLLREIE